MKNLLILFICLLSFNVFSQDDKHERINALRTAFFTEELNLSSKEAQAFWPIFNQYNDNMHTLYKKERSEIKDVLKKNNNVSEAQALTLIETGMSIEDSKVKERKNLVANLKGVIPNVKILKLFKAEDDFRRKLIKEYRERRKGERKE